MTQLKTPFLVLYRINMARDAASMNALSKVFTGVPRFESHDLFVFLQWIKRLDKTYGGLFTSAGSKFTLFGHIQRLGVSG